MKKNMTKSMLQDGFARKLQFTLLLFALILPLALKVLIDTPAGVADYICNSYAGIYPTATTMGLLFTQILTVAADMVRAGLIGCVLCALLYAVASGMDKTRMTIALTTALLSPIAVAGAGIGLNYLCVYLGLSRDTIYFFRNKLSQLMTAAILEYFLYAVLVVCSILILYWIASKNRGDLLADTDGFFSGAPMFRAVALTVALFGVISFIMTVSDMILDLKNYGNIFESLSGVMGYVVLPYVYLVIKLFAMLFFGTLLLRRLNRKLSEKVGGKK